MKRTLYLLMCFGSFMLTGYIILFWHNDVGGEATQAFSSNIESNKDSSVEENIPTISQSSKLKIFKVESDEILEKIEESKMQKIKYIVTKLSIIDLSKVKNILLDKSMVAENKLIKINKILAKRLSRNEYSEFKNLMEEYVDFDVLNGELA